MEIVAEVATTTEAAEAAEAAAEEEAVEAATATATALATAYRQHPIGHHGGRGEILCLFLL